MQKKAAIFLSVVLWMAALAGAAYLTRSYWAHWLPSAVPIAHEEGGFAIVEKNGVQCKVYYACPMHTQIIKPKAGDCPICGMTLMKKEEPVEGAKSTANMPGMEQAAATSEETASLEKVALDPRQRMLANVATEPVTYRENSRDVYTVGKVGYNERTVRKVTAWFPGRVEKLYVDFTGERVKKGEPIMSIYSPELITTQKEYLLAKDAAERLKASEFPEISSGTEGVVEAARTKMRLWGITDAQVEELDKTGRIKLRAEVFSPISGTVVEMLVREGDYLQEGSEMYRVADLSRVWVMADVYEYEFTNVALGGSAEVTSDAYPGWTFHGKVAFIDPVVNSDSRTVRVRVELPNEGGFLRPEMFVNVRIKSGSTRALTVPATAILYTGTKDVVWVETSPGSFEPREVRLGRRSGDYYEVLGGLKQGENVVTQGGFLIDSEAQLRAGGAGGMAGMDMSGGGKSAKPAGKATGKGMAGMKGM